MTFIHLTPLLVFLVDCGGSFEPIASDAGGDSPASEGKDGPRRITRNTIPEAGPSAYCDVVGVMMVTCGEIGFDWGPEGMSIPCEVGECPAGLQCVTRSGLLGACK